MGEKPLKPPFSIIRFLAPIYSHAPRGEGRKTPSARGFITIQYNPVLIFPESTFFQKPVIGHRDPASGALIITGRFTNFTLDRRGKIRSKMKKKSRLRLLSPVPVSRPLAGQLARTPCPLP